SIRVVMEARTGGVRPVVCSFGKTRGLNQQVAILRLLPLNLVRTPDRGMRPRWPSIVRNPRFWRRRRPAMRWPENQYTSVRLHDCYTQLRISIGGTFASMWKTIAPETWVSGESFVEVFTFCISGSPGPGSDWGGQCDGSTTTSILCGVALRSLDDTDRYPRENRRRGGRSISSRGNWCASS